MQDRQRASERTPDTLGPGAFYWEADMAKDIKAVAMKSELGKTAAHGVIRSILSLFVLQLT